MAAATKLSATIFILSLLFLATFSSGCGVCPGPKPKPKPSPAPKAPPVNPFCPRDTLKFGACANLLGMVQIGLGAPPTKGCCSLLKGLSDVEAAACLCTVIKANVLGQKLNIPIALSMLLSACQKDIPTGFKCN